jgi:hypothetical protein
MDDLFQELGTGKKALLAGGEAQENEIGRHRRPPPHQSHAAGVDVPIIAGVITVHENNPLGLQVKAVHSQIVPMQEKPHIRRPGRNERPPIGSHLDHGNDCAAPLGHAVGLRGDDRQFQRRGGFG